MPPPCWWVKRMGVEFTFVDPDCSDEELEAAFRPNTKAVFGETIANPALIVFDIERFANAAHAHGVPLIVDGTVLHDLQHLLGQSLAALAALCEHLAQDAGHTLLGADLLNVCLLLRGV